MAFRNRHILQDQEPGINLATGAPGPGIIKFFKYEIRHKTANFCRLSKSEKFFLRQSDNVDFITQQEFTKGYTLVFRILTTAVATLFGIS